MKKAKYFLALISFMPPLLFIHLPLFTTGWPLIGISTISIIILGIYIFENNLRLTLESNQGINMFFSWLDSFIMMSVLIISYTMALLFIIELSFRYNLNATLMFIICLLIAVPVIKSWRRIILNFIKTT